MRRTHGEDSRGRGEMRQRARSRGAFSAAGVMLEMRFTRREQLSNAQWERERRKRVGLFDIVRQIALAREKLRWNNECIPVVALRYAFILRLERNRCIRLDIREKDRKAKKYNLVTRNNVCGGQGRSNCPFDGRATCVLQG